MQADFEGHVQSLESESGWRLREEYLYLSVVIPVVSFPDTDEQRRCRISAGPIKPLLKLLIFTNDGRKIKEVDTE